jgi:tetratricopeptide (TPR) repeat protein
MREIEALYQSAVQLDPTYLDAWLELANARIKTYFWQFDQSERMLQRATDALDRAISLAPDDPAVLTEQGHHYYYGYRDYPRARQFYLKAAAKAPNDADVLSALGYIARREGRFGECLHYLEEAWQRDPRNLSLIQDIAMVNAAGRRYAESRAAWLQAQDLEPELLWMQGTERWQHFFEKGEWNEFETWLEGIPETTQRTDPVISSLVSNYLFMRNRLEEFLAWRRASMDPENGFSAMELPLNERLDYAWILKMMGREAESRPLLESVETALRAEITLNPGDYQALLRLGVTLAGLGKHEEAIAMADRAQEAMPESADAVLGPSISQGRLQVMIVCGRHEEALDEIERLLQIPWGGLNVYALREQILYHSLKDLPRFTAIIDDPRNNAPLF